jgi:putative transposase
MILEMRAVAQAAHVAKLTGGVHLPVESCPSRLSRRVSVGDLNEHRSAIESVSVLFKCFELVDGVFVERSSGWRVTGAHFEVEWPSEPDRVSLVRSHFGARRYAYNWALERVEADMEAKKQNPAHQSAPWTLPHPASDRDAALQGEHPQGRAPPPKRECPRTEHDPL